jgi:hypothetical protein
MLWRACNVQAKVRMRVTGLWCAGAHHEGRLMA